MARRITDAHLRTWEVFAAPGPFSAPRPARITFHCVSDFGVGSVSLEKALDRAEVERLIHEASLDELRDWLEMAVPVPQTGSIVSRLPQPMA